MSFFLRHSNGHPHPPVLGAAFRRPAARGSWRRSPPPLRQRQVVFLGADVVGEAGQDHLGTRVVFQKIGQFIEVRLVLRPHVELVEAEMDVAHLRPGDPGFRGGDDFPGRLHIGCRGNWPGDPPIARELEEKSIRRRVRYARSAVAGGLFSDSAMFQVLTRRHRTASHSAANRSARLSISIQRLFYDDVHQIVPLKSCLVKKTPRNRNSSHR